jgi:ATP/ADP translocase
MGRLLASIFGLRPEERDLALLMSGYHFLLLITLYLLKPVRDSLFLSSRGPAELPFVFVVTTIAVIPVAFLHTRAGKTLHVGRLIDGVSLLLVAGLVGLRWLLGVGGAWVTYVLYAWVSIYGLLVTSQFWLLANAIFSASQAKRVFAALSVGAILGAIVGGEITGVLVDQLDVRSPNLLWLTAAVLLASIGLVRYIRHRHRRRGGTLESRAAPAAEDDKDATDPAGGPARGDATGAAAGAEESGEGTVAGAIDIIRGSRHIQLIVGLIGLTVITTTVIDYQFKTVAAQAFATEQGLTTFMGRFYGRVSIVALLLQFVVAPRLMRVVGIGGALAVLPATLAMGAAAMIAVPGLVAGVLLRGSDQSLKHSIDKTGRELLFVPVSLEKKKRVKVFIDVFVDQGAQGLGGALLMVLAVGLGLGVQALAVVTLGLIALWGTVAYQARASYVDQFRRQLRRQAHVSEADEDTDDIDGDLDELLESLCSRNETAVLHALDTLEEKEKTVPVDALRCLLDHPMEAVREQAIRVLRVRGIGGVADDVVEALTDPDPDVQLEAARYLYCNSEGDRIERLQQALSHDDLRIQGAAVGLIAEEGGEQEHRLITENLLRRLIDAGGDVGEDARTHVARVLGVLDRPYRNELLFRLLRDDSAQVVRAALEAAGKTQERAFVYSILTRLENEPFEAAARRALVAYGRRILGTLYDYLVDPHVSLGIRRRIPTILSEQPCQLAVTVLVRSLDRVPVPVRHASVRALSKLHASGSYDFAASIVEEAIRDEARHHAALGQILRLRLRTTGAADRLEADRLRAYREESLERLFRLLGLRYDQRDIYDAYLGITSRDPSLRSSAVEFVDNLVDYNTSKYLMPLLDDNDGTQAVTAGGRLFDLRIRSWDQARTYAEAAEDPRLEADLHEEALPADVPDPVRAHAGDGAPAGASNGARNGASDGVPDEAAGLEPAPARDAPDE